MKSFNLKDSVQETNRGPNFARYIKAYFCGWKKPGKLDVEVEEVKGRVGEKEKVLLKIKPERFLKGSLDPGEESEGSS